MGIDSSRIQVIFFGFQIFLSSALALFSSIMVGAEITGMSVLVVTSCCSVFLWILLNYFRGFISSSGRIIFSIFVSLAGFYLASFVNLNILKIVLCAIFSSLICVSTIIASFRI